MILDDWLDACASEPDDDLRRLVFADWLEENGDPDWAEFIRLEVGLSRGAEHDPETADRVSAMLKKHRTRWIGPLGNVKPKFRHRIGFVSRNDFRCFSSRPLAIMMSRYLPDRLMPLASPLSNLH